MKYLNRNMMIVIGLSCLFGSGTLQGATCPIELIGDHSVSAATGGYIGGIVSYLNRSGFRGDVQSVVADFHNQAKAALDRQKGVTESLRIAATKAEAGDRKMELVDRYEAARVQPLYDQIMRTAETLYRLANPGQGRGSGYALEAIRETLRQDVKRAVDPDAPVGYRRPPI